jgi:Ca2+-binding EF-hand superfamily protein
MRTALIALPFAAQLIAPAFVDASAGKALEQSQFTRPSQAAETMRFRDMDRNNDGVITRGEWRGSEASFRAHDWNSDGILSGNEVRSDAVRPSDQSQPDAGILEDREDTFENLDVNRNNQIERHEWHASADAFQWLDRNKDGVLSRREMIGRGANRSAVSRDRAGSTSTGAVGTAGQGNCEANPAKIVDDIYQQVLERPADQASGGMTQALASGRMTVREVVTQVAKSDEHASRYFWQPVTTVVYRQVLNREPSQQELQQTSSELASGQRQLVDVIGRAARRAANTDEEAVRILYRRLLGREADEAGLRGFTEQARRDGIESVARDIVASAEYRQRAGSSGLHIDDAAYENAVRTLYRHLLGRDPDGGAARTYAQTAAASGFDAVIDAIVNSAEYQQRFGTDVVPGRGVRYCGGR